MAIRYEYFQVFQYYPEEDADGEEGNAKRLIYTFNNEVSANDIVEFILKNDFMQPNIGVVKYEAPAKL